MLNAFLEFMTTYHSTGRRGAYGWMLVLGAASVLFSVHAARRLKVNRTRRLSEYSVQAASGPLTAVVIVESGACQTRRVEGKVRGDNSGHLLSMVDTVNGVTSESTHRFDSIDQVEAFLEAQTILRLRDFKQD